jgi:hypothetical protein
MLPIRNLPWCSTAAAIFTEPRLEVAHPIVLGCAESFSNWPPHRATGRKRFCIALPAAQTEIHRIAASFLDGTGCSMAARLSEGRGSARLLTGLPVAARFTKCSRKAQRDAPVGPAIVAAVRQDHSVRKMHSVRDYLPIVRTMMRSVSSLPWVRSFRMTPSAAWVTSTGSPPSNK